MTPALHSPVPEVSVVLTTYRRPALLGRAIESVLGQTFGDFELIICDDENPGGESRLIGERFASGDRRVRYRTNPDTRGQVSNFNFGLRSARGRWIKPLHDDDWLDPDCLARMLDAGERSGDRAAVVRCLATRHERDRRRVERLGARARVEELSPDRALRAMYLQDVDICTPSQVLVSRHAIERGALMPAIEGLVSNVDSAWMLELVAHGSMVLLNEPLVHQLVGGVGGDDRHHSVTGSMSDRGLDSEFALIREMQYARLGSIDGGAPSPREIQAMLRAVRAMHRLRFPGKGRLGDACVLASSVRSLRAWRRAIRWALRRSFPGRFEIVPRVDLTTEPRFHDARRDSRVRVFAQRAGAHDGVPDAPDHRAAG